MATAAGNKVRRPAAYRFPPGFERNLLWFAFRKFRPANPILLFQHLAEKYGDIAHYKIGWHHITFLNHPDYIREVLVVQNDNFIKERTVQRTKMLLGEGMITAEGVQHRSQRQVAQPSFHRQSIPAYADQMVREAARMRDCFRDGETRDIAIDMMHLTLNVVAQTLFATDLREEADELASAINRIMGLYNFLVILPAAEWLVHVRPPGLAAFVRARKRIDAVVYRMITAHRQRGSHGGSLLDLMIAASPDQSPAAEQALRDQIITIFLAGYETVANALSWTWCLLSRSPDCERRFHEEIDRELKGRLPTYEDLPRLRYVEMVLAESMRLYPPAWAMGRYARNDFQLGAFFFTREDDGADEPVRHSPRSTILSRSLALRSGTIHARGQGQAGEVRLLPIRCGISPMHRRIVCLDGGRAAAGHTGTEMEVQTCSRTSRRTGAADHASSQVRYEDAGRCP